MKTPVESQLETIKIAILKYSLWIELLLAAILKS